MRLNALLLSSAALLAVVLPSCDNPACVFGGDCSQEGSGGALGSAGATLPSEGETVLPEAVRFERMLPSGDTADPATPIVLFFNEAIAGSNPGTAFELVGDDGVTTLPISVSSVVGDGRVLVLYPVVPGGSGLTPGSGWTVRLKDGQQIVDRNGQVLVPPSSRNFGEFGVAATAPDRPAVLATYPGDITTNNPTTTEVVVVFTRPVDPFTVTTDSFVVTVDGVVPDFNPEPEAVSLGGVQSDNRVWRWRSVDEQGVARSLGTSSSVAVRVSPTASQVADEDGSTVAVFDFDFDTMAVSAPTAAYISSTPSDAIGIDALSGPAYLAITVECPDAAAGDFMSLYVYGRDPATAQNAPLLSLFREVAMEAPFTSFTLTAAEVNLLATTTPPTGRVKEGTVDFAFCVRRGGVRTPVELLDVDQITDGRQSATLDLTRPTLAGFGVSGADTATFRSDQRDLCVLARGSERIEWARVRVGLDDNELEDGLEPEVLGGDSNGLFLAAPLRGLGVGGSGFADAPLEFELVVYDRARNASAPVTALWESRGAAAQGASDFLTVTVEVYDAQTLAPVPGAAVYVHERVGPAVDFIAPDRGNTTDADGLATLPCALSGVSIVTVDAPGYGLVTLDGVSGARTSIGLLPVSAGSATVAGLVTSTNPLAASTALTKQVRDSRQEDRAASIAVAGCTQSVPNQRLECAFGPAPVRPRRTGALSAFAYTPAASALSFAAELYLSGWAMNLPVPPSAGSTQAGLVVSLDPLLADPAAPEGSLAFEPGTFAVLTDGAPALSGALAVRVDGLVPGLAGSAAVGHGQTFELAAGNHVVRTAAAGAVRQEDLTDPDAPVAAGELVARGTVEPDLFLRVDAAYNGGGSAAVRPRVSSAPTPAAPLAMPEPLVSLSTSDALLALELVGADKLPAPGVHRAVVTGATTRSWTIYSLSAGAGGEVRFALPFVGAKGGLPLEPSAGIYAVTVDGYAWETFDAADWGWCDLERQATWSARTAPLNVPVSVP